MDPKAALTRFIRWVMRDTLYLGQYAATVQRQAADDTLDLLPDDERLRGTGLSGVPIRHGLPGARVRVADGARVLLGFEGGDPRKPYASLWSASTIVSISLGEAPAAAARQGDAVEVLIPPAVFTGTINGLPATGVVSWALPKAVGIITAGSAKVSIGT